MAPTKQIRVEETNEQLCNEGVALSGALRCRSTLCCTLGQNAPEGF